MLLAKDDTMQYEGVLVGMVMRREKASSGIKEDKGLGWRAPMSGCESLSRLCPAIPSQWQCLVVVVTPGIPSN